MMLKLNGEADREARFQEVRQEFLTPRQVRPGSLTFFVLFLLFVLSQFDGLKSVPGIIVLVGVVLLHEAGHMFGMLVFGFRDIRMFFIPFLGAAASGRSVGASTAKHALVSLLGPLPGVLLGFGGLFVLIAHPSELLLTAVQTLLLVNVFNLLPFGWLDGGRFLQRVLFSRHRILEVFSFVLGSAALIAVAVQLDAPTLAIFSLLGLLSLFPRWNVLKAAAALRATHPTLVPDPQRLSELEVRALFESVQVAMQAPKPLPPAVIATTMHEVANAMQRPPGVFVSLGLLLLYLFGWIVAFVSIIGLVVITGGPLDWQKFERPGWRAELPTYPYEHDAQEPTPAGMRPAKVTRANHDVERFTIEAVEGDANMAPESWIESSRDALQAELGATRVREERVTTAGHSGREVEFASSHRVWRTRIYVAHGKLYRITASAPKWGENQRRFFDSFTLIAPPDPPSKTDLSAEPCAPGKTPCVR